MQTSTERGAPAELTDTPALPSISVIIPVFDAQDWIEPTVRHVEAAVRRSAFSDVEIVLVDDGSGDRSGEVMDALTSELPLRIVHQENSGRFIARLRGLEAAHGSSAFLIDIRVFVDDTALAFLAEQLRAHPDRQVWNGHTRTATSWKPWTRFWNPLTFMAWRTYLAKPTTTSFGIDDYDDYPKGTGFFFAPRQHLIDLCAAFDTSYDDVSKASDDTLLIKPLAETMRINISPDFGGLYFPRDKFGDFIRHSYFRGTTFVDGHLRPGNRFNTLFWRLVPIGIVGAAALLRWPKRVGTSAAVGLATLPLAGRAVGIPLADGMSFAVLAPLFTVVYSTGIARGLWMRFRARATPPGTARSQH